MPRGEIHESDGCRSHIDSSCGTFTRKRHDVIGDGHILRWNSASPTIVLYDGFQSPAAAPVSGRVSPESHDAIATISAWS